MKKEDVKNFTDVMLTTEIAEILYDLISAMPEKGRLLETGTGLGRSAGFFATLKPGWKIYTVDAFGLYGDGRVYKKLDHKSVVNVFEYLSPFKNIVQIFGNSSTISWELDIDVLYIDADHTFAGCSKDFFNYEKFLNPGGLLIFDDYTQPNNPANEVAKFVDSIRNYEVIYKGVAAILRK